MLLSECASRAIISPTQTADPAVQTTRAGLPAALTHTVNVSSRFPGKAAGVNSETSAGLEKAPDSLFICAARSSVARNKDSSPNVDVLNAESFSRLPARLQLPILIFALDKYCVNAKSIIENLKYSRQRLCHLSPEDSRTLYVAIKRCLPGVSSLPIDRASALVLAMCGTLRSLEDVFAGPALFQSQIDGVGKPLICEIWQDFAILWRALSELDRTEVNLSFTMDSNPALRGFGDCVVSRIAPDHEVRKKIVNRLHGLMKSASDVLLRDTLNSAVSYLANLETFRYSRGYAASSLMGSIYAEGACAALFELSVVGEKFSSNFAELWDSAAISTDSGYGLLDIVDSNPTIFLGLV